MREMKTALRETSSTISVLTQYLSDSATAHRSEMSQISTMLVVLHNAAQTILKTMHARFEVQAVESRIMENNPHPLQVSVATQPYDKTVRKGTSSFTGAPYVQPFAVHTTSRSQAVSENRRVQV